MRTRSLALPAAALVALTAAGCTGSSPGTSATVTVSGEASSSPATPSASPSPSATAFTVGCEDGLSLTTVSEAAGQPIIGRTAFVVGAPDPSIGRLAYINCRYGLPDTPAAAATAVPLVEIGVSLYSSAAKATARVDGTVEDYRGSGAAATTVRVGTVNGTILKTRGQPATLVVASEERTVAVSVQGRVYTGDDQIAAIAQLALDRVVV